MTNEPQKTVMLIEHILDASGLVKGGRYYNALAELVHEGLMMNDVLGKNDTEDFAKTLDKIGLEYRFFDDGIELKENSRTNYYIKEIYSKWVVPESKSILRDKDWRRFPK